MPKPYSDFKLAMRKRESSNRYDCVNKLGYLGAYQFGMARLCDLGMTKRMDPKSRSFSNSTFEFIPPLTKEEFLESPEIQESCFDHHVRLLKEEVIKLSNRWGSPIDLSGAIAGAHLLGAEGLLDYIVGGIDSSDGFGTKISEYYMRFSGYEIP